jgi:hypothetical protein
VRLAMNHWRLAVETHNSNFPDAEPRRVAQPADGPRVWEVGYRIATLLRAARSAAAANDEGGSHASSRPHIRRGHWHTYCLGPWDSEHGRREHAMDRTRSRRDRR